jgi:hypothetical protein
MLEGAPTPGPRWSRATLEASRRSHTMVAPVPEPRSMTRKVVVPAGRGDGRLLPFLYGTSHRAC